MIKRFVKWLDNFWYHNKVAVLLILFAVAVVIFASVSYFNNRGAGVYVTYAGPYSFSISERKAAREALGALLIGAQTNGGSEASFSSIYYMTNEQLKAAYDEAFARGDTDFKVSDYLMTSNLEDLDLEVKAGDSLLYLLDPYLYDKYAATDGWVSLRQIFDEFPSEISYDPYAILLMKTDFGKYYFPYLPEDTILCMRRISSYSFLTGREAEEANRMYEDGIKLFERILAFKTPEDTEAAS